MIVKGKMNLYFQRFLEYTFQIQRRLHMIKYIFIVFLLIIPSLSQSQEPTPSAREVNQPPKNDRNSKYTKSINMQRGSKDLPVFVETLETQSDRDEKIDNRNHREKESTNNWWIMVFTGGLLFTASAQIGLFYWQLWLIRRSIEDTKIAASAAQKSADVAEKSVEIMSDTAKKQLRAYLSVTIGSGSFQDRFSKIKFEVVPSLDNSGSTPAHKITYWAKSEILPVPLPDDFNFPHVDNKFQSSFVLGPNQGISLNAIVDEYIPDSEVEEVKIGNNRRVYIWGIVSYEDVFGDSHYTKFCHSIYFFTGADGLVKVSGHYDKNYNDAT